MKIKLTSLLAIAALLLTAACAKPENDRPAYIPDDDEGNSGGTGREFCIFDQWGAYKGKPDVLNPKCSKLLIAYEAFLLGEDDKNSADDITDWETISDKKIQTQISIAKLNNITTISADVEHWYTTRDAEGIKSGLKTIFDKFKEGIPGCSVGNYGVPVMDLNVMRFGLKGWTEEQIQERWISDSQRRMPAGEVSDVLYPSMYTMNDDLTQYEKDVKITADYIRKNFPGKKIYAYVWPQFYNLHSEPKDFYQEFMSAEQWTRVLEACFENFDGIVLWCHGNGPDDQPVPWSDSRLQEINNATQRFINNHYDDIAVASGSSVTDIEREPTEFHVWGSFGFKNTPDNLLKFGVEPINVVRESSVSEPDRVDGVLPPILGHIEHIAEHVTANPVFIRMSSWIIDRSTNPTAMDNRFKSVYETFKSKNDYVTLGYSGIGPTALTSLFGYDTEFARKDSWLRYAVMPCRGLRQYADVLYPEVFIVNDDMEAWKTDIKNVLEEARLSNPGKKIYACLGTTYQNSTERFADALTPIKEETLLEALEFLYLRCDGIVFFDNTSEEKRATYSENLGFMKALARFYANHKSLIDATLPTEFHKDNIPPYQPGQEDGPGEDVPDVQGELVTNGGFEDQVVPDANKINTYHILLERLPRLTSYFDRTAVLTHPTMPAGTTVEDGTWFHRCNNPYWFWFNYINDPAAGNDGTPNAGYKPVAHTGTRSLGLYAQDVGPNANNSAYPQIVYQSHANNLSHLFGAAQRLSLDDTKKYTLKFWWHAPISAWSTATTGAGANSVEKIVVGIVSSNGADANTDYTYEQEIDVTTRDTWTECTITFDIPTIVQNTGKSFNRCAIFFNLVPKIDADGKVLRSQINIDDVSLTVAEI